MGQTTRKIFNNAYEMRKWTVPCPCLYGTRSHVFRSGRYCHGMWNIRMELLEIKRSIKMKNKIA